MKKIKKFRQAGLEEEGEYSNENLVFKYLRNNKVIKALIDIRNQSYDKMMSINGNPEKLFKIYLDKKTWSEYNETARWTFATPKRQMVFWMFAMNGIGDGF